MQTTFRIVPLALGAFLFSACSDKPDLDDLSAPVPPGRARAGVITKAAELIGGPAAAGEMGDFKLYNSRIAVVVEKPGPSHGYNTYGGLVVDADVVRPRGEPGESLFGEAINLYNGRTPRGVSAKVISDGRQGGRAVVRVHAVDDEFPLIDTVLGPNKGPLSLEMDIDYILEPDTNVLQIVTTFHNKSAESLPISMNYVGYVMGEGLRQFLPGYGFDVPMTAGAADYYAAAAEKVSYSFYAPDSGFQPIIAFDGFQMGSFNPFVLQANDVYSVGMNLVIGDGDLAFHEREHRALAVKADVEDLPEVRAVSGTVKDAAGGPVANARVHVTQPSGQYVMQTVSRADGAFSLELPDGSYRALATAQGRDPGEAGTLTVAGGAAEIELRLGGLGFLEAKGTENGEPLPVKLQAVRADAPPPLPASFGLDRRHHGFEVIEFLPPGGARLALPPGTYTVHLSRGTEYEAVTRTVQIVAGETASFAADLPRPVKTPGWVSSDFHIHAQYSPDSDDLYDHKVRAFAAEGLEVPINTEHEHINDYTDTIAKLGMQRWMFTVVGSEISTTTLGHFNAFPLERDLLAANFGAISWFGVKGDDLMKLIRQNAAGPFVQVNHPRSRGTGIVKGYFSGVEFNAETFTAKDVDNWSVDYDGFEIANSGAPGDENYADWFAFLDRGIRMVATGDSDSHKAVDDWVGYPRNYVLTGVDRPNELTQDVFMSAVRAGRISISGGFFVEAGAGDARPGDFVGVGAIVDGKLRLDVKVQAASWVPGGTLEVLVNGESVVTRTVPEAEPGDDGLRLSETFDVEVRSDVDSYVIARVSSEGRMRTVFEGARAFGVTNPIFLDANGNGKLDARIPR